MIFKDNHRVSICRSKFLTCSLLVIAISIGYQVAQSDGGTNNLQVDEVPKLNVNRLLVIVVASGNQLPDRNWEDFQRFNRSVASNSLELTVLSHQDGESEVQMIKKALANYKKEQDSLILLVDGYHSILNAGKKEILEKFAKSGSQSTRILFAADSNFRPNTPEWASMYQLANLVQPSSNLAKDQPYLNANGLVGFAPELWTLFADADRNESIQERCNRAYLDPEQRKTLNLALDHKSYLFQSLSDPISVHLELIFPENEENKTQVFVKNHLQSTEPAVMLAGSGQSERILLSHFGNYLANHWTARDGCLYCNATRVELKRDSNDQLPSVLIGIFIEEPTPFLDDFFRTIRELDYQRSRIHLIVHNTVKYHARQVELFLNEYGPTYGSFKLLSNFSLPSPISGEETSPEAVTQSLQPSLIQMNEWQARNYAFEWCNSRPTNCDYYLSLDSIARLELPQTLRLLIEANRTIVAPMLSRYRKLWSNFWGAVTDEGFYLRSSDYVELVRRTRVGLWTVPHISNAYLIKGDLIRGQLMSIGAQMEGNSSHADPTPASVDSASSPIDYKLNAPGGPSLPSFSFTFQHQNQQHQQQQQHVKPSLAFSQQLRSMGLNQYVINTHDFGHLADPTTYNTELTNPDFYQLETNMIDWERNYLHENYSGIFESDPEVVEDEDEIEASQSGSAMGPKPNKFIEEPCSDVYWFPLVSELFSRSVIEIMESFGRWSGGKHEDSRIEGGYESVPTNDIHFKQVGLHEMWLTFLREYVQPVQSRQYIGYDRDPPSTDLAFVVRYNPSEQPSLRPHHDASTYTLNIALNSPGLHYSGGGCRFVRYNCSVVDTRQGWALIHPGRLTHYHEGLPVTRGTRYILVTFIDP